MQSEQSPMCMPVMVMPAASANMRIWAMYVSVIQPKNSWTNEGLSIISMKMRSPMSFWAVVRIP